MNRWMVEIRYLVDLPDEEERSPTGVDIDRRQDNILINAIKTAFPRTADANVQILQVESRVS